MFSVYMLPVDRAQQIAWLIRSMLDELLDPTPSVLPGKRAECLIEDYAEMRRDLGINTPTAWYCDRGQCYEIEFIRAGEDGRYEIHFWRDAHEIVFLPPGRNILINDAETPNDEFFLSENGLALGLFFERRDMCLQEQKAREIAERDHWKTQIEQLMVDLERETDFAEQLPKMVEAEAARAKLTRLLPEIADSLLAEAKFHWDEDPDIARFVIGDLIIWPCAKADMLTLAIEFANTIGRVRTPSQECTNLLSFAEAYSLCLSNVKHNVYVKPPSIDRRTADQMRACEFMEEIIATMKEGKSLTRAMQFVYGNALIGHDMELLNG